MPTPMDGGLAAVAPQRQPSLGPSPDCRVVVAMVATAAPSLGGYRDRPHPGSHLPQCSSTRKNPIAASVSRTAAARSESGCPESDDADCQDRGERERNPLACAAAALAKQRIEARSSASAGLFTRPDVRPRLGAASNCAGLSKVAPGGPAPCLSTGDGPWERISPLSGWTCTRR